MNHLNNTIIKAVDCNFNYGSHGENIDLDSVERYFWDKNIRKEPHKALVMGGVKFDQVLTWETGWKSILKNTRFVRKDHKLNVNTLTLMDLSSHLDIWVCILGEMSGLLGVLEISVWSIHRYKSSTSYLSPSFFLTFLLTSNLWVQGPSSLIIFVNPYSVPLVYSHFFLLLFWLSAYSLFIVHFIFLWLLTYACKTLWIGIVTYSLLASVWHSVGS